jgi:hypothetical protein
VTRRRIAIAAAGVALAWACAGAPPPASQPPCRTRPDEASLEIDCGPTPDARWQQESIDEAKKAFERNSPQGREP